jgi:hypothetical protein
MFFYQFATEHWAMPGQGISMTVLSHQFKFAGNISMQGAFQNFTISGI